MRHLMNVLFFRKWIELTVHSPFYKLDSESIILRHRYVREGMVLDHGSHSTGNLAPILLDGCLLVVYHRKKSGSHRSEAERPERRNQAIEKQT